MGYPNITSGADRRAEAFEAMCDADLLNAGLSVRSAHPAADDFRGDAWPRRVRQILDAQGIAHRPLSDPEAIETAMRSVGVGTVDIAAYVQNTLQRAVGEGFASAPSIWRKIARGIALENFRPTPAGAVLEVPATLRKIAEQGEAKTPAVAARAETITPATYGENLAFTRQAMLAGDLAGTVRLAEALGRAASWTIDDLLIDLLTSNSGVGPTLAQDSLALFHTTHANYITSGGAPSVATLNVGRAALRKQRDQNSSRRMNIAARTLLVPAALESTALILAASEAVPGIDAPLDVVVAARLDDANAAGWYLLADPRTFDTLAVGHVGEGEEPSVVVEPLKSAGWSTDAAVFAVRVFVGVAALDYRGMFYNDGA
jgi:hypothetical protein